MDNKEFKKIVGEVLRSKGFQLERKIYYARSKELIACIDFQKSNFDNSFFINFGFTLVSLNPNLKYPRSNTSDVMGRFICYDKGEKKPSFNLECLCQEELVKSVLMNLESNVLPVVESGLERYFKINPAAKSVAKLSVKQYLKLE